MGGEATRLVNVDEPTASNFNTEAKIGEKQLLICTDSAHGCVEIDAYETNVC
jgi:hypothetical protein